MHLCFARAVLASCLILLSIAFLPGAAGASELVFSAEISESYEDNVIGLTADNPNAGISGIGGGPTRSGMLTKGGMGGFPGGGGGGGSGTGGSASARAGDFSTFLYADIGWDQDLTDASGLLFLVSVEHKAYRTYSDFDFTIGMFSMEVSGHFSERVSGSISAMVSRKDFDGGIRDSTAYGIALSLKERLTPDLWLRESVSAEQNISRSAVYDYTGLSAAVLAGYDVTERQTLLLRYSYLIRDFKDSAPAFELTSQVAGLDWSYDLNDDWTMLAGYHHEWADSTVPNTETTNNVYSVGLRYDY